MIALSLIVALSGSILVAIPAFVLAFALVAAASRRAFARDAEAHMARVDAVAAISTFSVDDFALLASWEAQPPRRQFKSLASAALATLAYAEHKAARSGQ